MSYEFYLSNCYKVSKLLTKNYSTSFSLATSLLKREQRNAIYAIYGFVRTADEIVDSFHNFEKEFLLEKLYQDLNYALEKGISTNVVLMAFADTVRKYNINKDHIDAFMNSMRKDLDKKLYHSTNELKSYIYGSADVVGLMCLKVFCEGNESLYNELKHTAQRLGTAFQKVNFIRDLKDDIMKLGRKYFPEISNNNFDNNTKKQIEESIEKDFSEALKGIKKLPGRSKIAVASAYFYFMGVFKKIKRSSPEKLLTHRIRISNVRKYLIIIKVVIMYMLKLI